MSLWNAEREEVLREGWQRGDSFGVIASKLDCGITRNACIGKAHRMGLNGKSKPLEARHRRRRIGDGIKVRNGVHRKRLVALLTPAPEVLRPYSFRAIQLVELGRNECRYPSGEGASILFCGQPTIPGTSWCRNCSRIVYNPRASDRWGADD